MRGEDVERDADVIVLRDRGGADPREDLEAAIADLRRHLDARLDASTASELAELRERVRVAEARAEQAREFAEYAAAALARAEATTSAIPTPTHNEPTTVPANPRPRSSRLAFGIGFCAGLSTAGLAAAVVAMVRRHRQAEQHADEIRRLGDNVDALTHLVQALPPARVTIHDQRPYYDHRSYVTKRVPERVIHRERLRVEQVETTLQPIIQPTRETVRETVRLVPKVTEKERVVHHHHPQRVIERPVFVDRPVSVVLKHPPATPKRRKPKPPRSPEPSRYIDGLLERAKRNARR